MARGKAEATRGRLLDATKQILVERGVGQLTLDAVAELAGVSKGGLLYHFPSKAALVEGLAERLRDYTRANLERAAEAGTVRTFLETSLPHSAEAEHYWAVFSALRSGIDVSDETRDLVQEVFTVWSDALRADVADPVLADIIRLVGDGLYLGAVLGLEPLDAPALERVFARLDVDLHGAETGR
ncbi:TetR/AcrR family transcriptional regulator [Iamia sp. SCSIO 61187]|uniref:TetR/AcrR family transcriptional regulator n=1 Tax=Iamia sp. SCSIO 61187 TaxID=2722752 RepID=UPI001C63455A|nr:TetR/AcrR family transcriptional regulator [Iamia sp. SCSIO 61187]QYG91458.1 TetR/AcrR family transcriptional regulator [Iamia sp. SCSIO 61187]